MAGRQTAVLGIYPDYASVEKAVDVLKGAGFRNKDISVLFPEKAGSKALPTTKGPGLQRVLPQAPERVRCWAVHSDGWWASALWRYRVWVPLSPPVRSWRPWREWAWAVQSAG